MTSPLVTAPFPVAGRRLLLLADRRFSPAEGKTAVCLAMYHPGDVVAVLDSSRAGRSVRDVLGVDCDAPVLATIEEALRARPEVAVVGVAPTGGVLDAADRAVVARCLEMGVDVVSGMHDFLADDDELSRARARIGRAYLGRAPRHGGACRFGGRRVPYGCAVVLTVGSDCGVGKMTVALELERAARRAGACARAGPRPARRASCCAVAAFRSTAWWRISSGVPPRRWSTRKATRPRWCSWKDRAPSCTRVTGRSCSACCMDRCRTPWCSYTCRGGRLQALSIPIPPLREVVAGYESMMRPYKRSRVVALALNTSALFPSDARLALADARDDTGLPAGDVVRFGAAPCWSACARLWVCEPRATHEAGSRTDPGGNRAPVSDRARDQEACATSSW